MTTASLIPPADAQPADPAIAVATRDAAANPRRGVHIPALDGLRGLAILLVLLFHFAPYDPHYTGLRLKVVHLLGMGWVGVDLFFVLSGFLITSILWEAKQSKGYFRNFYMRRVLRIFPLYYGVLFVAFAVIPLVRPYHSLEYQNVARHQAWLWTYLCNFTHLEWAGFTHFWSLAVEEQFYLVWPAVVLLLNRRALMSTCAALIVAALVIRLFRVATHCDPQMTYYFTPCRMDALATGALLALAAHGPAGITSLARPARWIALASALLLLAIFVSNRATFSLLNPRVQTIGYSLLAAFFGAGLVLSVTAPSASLLGRALNNTTLRFFGKYSYGLYVLHGLLHPWIEKRLPFKTFSANLHSFYLGLLAYAAIGTGISLAGALLSWHLYEKHFLKLKRFFEYRARTLTEPVTDAIVRGRDRPEQNG